MNAVSRRHALTAAGAGVAAAGLSVGSAQQAAAAGAGATPVTSPVTPAPAAPSSAVVTRTTATMLYRANVRDTPSLAGRIVMTLANATVIKGSYDPTRLWFQVAQGPLAGRWVASSVLIAAPIRAVNGRLAASDLTQLPSWTINRSEQPGVARFLSVGAAAGYLAMADEFLTRFGVNLTITEAYRTLSRQQLLYRTLGYPRAAIPGTSNHGLGNAIDFGIAGTSAWSSPLYYGRAYDTWLTANSKRFGFDRPDYMDRRGSNPEWWHYNFVG